MKREFLQEIRVGDQGLPKEVIDAIMAEHGKGIEAAKSWEEKYKQAVSDHEKEVAELTFSFRMQEAVAARKGKNAKAIMALLDMDALKKSENPQSELEKALDALQASDGYLFDTDATPPPYARGTGAKSAEGKPAPASLADALRERNH